MNSLQTLGHRQRALLESLLFSENGMTVDEIATSLSISRNAVKQHLSTLESFGFIHNKIQSSTGGRPSKRYILSSEGKEIFPRNYALFSNLLMRLLKDKLGSDTLSQYMIELGQSVADEYRGQINKKHNFTDRVAALASIMQELGYSARMEENSEGIPEIIANNCVFHKLASECASICDLDTALITSSLGGASVEHKECMIRGDTFCRFSITQPIKLIDLGTEV